MSVMPAMGAIANGDGSWRSRIFIAGRTSAASTCTLTPWPIRFTARISRACVPLRVSRPTTPVSGPCTTSTIVPVLIVGHGS